MTILDFLERFATCEVEVDKLFLGGIEEVLPGTILRTNGWRGCNDLSGVGYNPRLGQGPDNPESSSP